MVVLGVWSDIVQWAGWDWHGWLAVSALLGLGTVALAAVTLSLARSTRRLAVATEKDLSAQWRPVLLPPQPEGSNVPTASVGETKEGGGMSLQIHNGGRGPALFVRGELEPLGASPADWGRASVAAGERVWLRFSSLPWPPLDHMRLRLDYRDLSGLQYSTATELETRTSQHGVLSVNVYNVWTFAGRSITHHGDAQPQPGLEPLQAREGDQ